MLLLRTMMTGSLNDFQYECTSISAAALLAAYGFVGASSALSVQSALPAATSPYTSSVLTCTKRRSVPQSFAQSSSTCVP